MDPLLRIAVNLACAIVAGSLIGWERSYFGRAAGLRTHVLLALGAATAMSMTTWPGPVVANFPPHTFQMDPARLAQGVLTGIGFIGAGVIAKEGVSLYGLTSAASIWVTTVIGIEFGLGYWQVGGGVTLATLLVLVFLRRAELNWSRQVYALARFTFEAARAPGQRQLTDWLASRGTRLNHVSFKHDADQGRREYSGTVQVRCDDDFVRLEQDLAAFGGLLDFELVRNNK